MTAFDLLALHLKDCELVQQVQNINHSTWNNKLDSIIVTRGIELATNCQTCGTCASSTSILNMLFDEL